MAPPAVFENSVGSKSVEISQIIPKNNLQSQTNLENYQKFPPFRKSINCNTLEKPLKPPTPNVSVTAPLAVVSNFCKMLFIRKLNLHWPTLLSSSGEERIYWVFVHIRRHNIFSPLDGIYL